MRKVAKLLTDYVIKKSMVDEADREVYEYGFVITLEVGLFLVFNSHPRFTFCKRVSHFESDLQILYPTFHFCNDFPVFSLAFMI